MFRNTNNSSWITHLDPKEDWWLEIGIDPKTNKWWTYTFKEKGPDQNGIMLRSALKADALSVTLTFENEVLRKHDSEADWTRFKPVGGGWIQ